MKIKLKLKGRLGNESFVIHRFVPSKKVNPIVGRKKKLKQYSLGECHDH